MRIDELDSNLQVESNIAEPELFATRREVVRDTYETALREGDQNVYFIDGGEAFEG